MATKRKPKEEYKKRGRPTLYSPKLIPHARNLCGLGATDLEIAEFFEVDVATLYRWKNSYPDFRESLKMGKDQADVAVENSLYRRATGYTHKAVKIFMPAGASTPVYAPYQEHTAPDTTAAIFWLKNRRPQEWRDRQESDAPPITINNNTQINVQPLELVQRIAFLLTQGAAIASPQPADDNPTDLASAPVRR